MRLSCDSGQWGWEIIKGNASDQKVIDDAAALKEKLATLGQDYDPEPGQLTTFQRIKAGWDLDHMKQDIAFYEQAVALGMKFYPSEREWIMQCRETVRRC